METLIDEIARATEQDPVAYRLRAGRRQAPAPPRRAAAGGRQERLRQEAAARRPRLGRGGARVLRLGGGLCGRGLGEGRPPVLHRVTAGVHCNLVVNPRTVEAQVQGAALMGLSMCLPGAAITLKDGVVEQSNFGDYVVPRITDMPRDRGAHRAQRRSAHRHGRARPAAAGAGVRQRDRAAHRQAGARAAVHGLSGRRAAGSPSVGGSVLGDREPGLELLRIAQQHLARARVHHRTAVEHDGAVCVIGRISAGSARR